MAERYLIHGAAYCGDGTASNEAASAGAAGAWNNINVLEGSAPAYGALAAGDTVYIRSKTSGGADITRTLAANATLGYASATDAAWVRWVVDGGTVWSGINGTVQYDCPSTYTVTLRSYNSFECEVQDRFVIREANAAAYNKVTLIFAQYTQMRKVLIDLSYATTSGGAYGAHVAATTANSVINLYNTTSNPITATGRWYPGRNTGRCSFSIQTLSC